MLCRKASVPVTILHNKLNMDTNKGSSGMTDTEKYCISFRKNVKQMYLLFKSDRKPFFLRDTNEPSANEMISCLTYQGNKG